MGPIDTNLIEKENCIPIEITEFGERVNIGAYFSFALSHPEKITTYEKGIWNHYVVLGNYKLVDVGILEGTLPNTIQKEMSASQVAFELFLEGIKNYQIETLETSLLTFDDFWGNKLVSLELDKERLSNSDIGHFIDQTNIESLNGKKTSLYRHERLSNKKYHQKMGVVIDYR